MIREEKEVFIMESSDRHYLWVSKVLGGVVPLQLSTERAEISVVEIIPYQGS